MSQSQHQKTQFEAMTWLEVADRLKSDPVVLVPMGSVEQHGPQTPVGDYRYIEHVSEEVAKRTNALSVPVLPFGYSEYFRCFPGCISLRHETLAAVLRDILDSLHDMGARRFLILCGHKGNMLTIEQVGRDLLRERDVRLAVAEPWTWFDAETCDRIYGTTTPPLGHGSDPFTSLGLALYEHQMRMDLAEKEARQPWEGIRVLNPGTAVLEDHGVPFRLFLDMDEVTRNGVTGDAEISSPQIGRQLFDHVIDRAVSIVRYLEQLPAETLKRKGR